MSVITPCRFIRALFCVLAIACPGCATQPTIRSTSPVQPPIPDTGFYHTVLRGETVWRIAQMYGVSVEDISSVNDLSDVTSIEAGRRIRIPRSQGGEKPVIRPVPRSGEDFIWPVEGKILSYYGSQSSGITAKGIVIGAVEGTPVHAARSGKVVFCDNYFKGLGKTIIIDHGDDFSSVYAQNAQLLVGVGDTVGQGEPIATVGSTGRAAVSSLHFEIRKKHKAQNPLFFLKRS